MKKFFVYVFLSLVFLSCKCNAQEIGGIKLGSTTKIDTVINYVFEKPYYFFTFNEDDGRCVTISCTPCKSSQSYMGRGISYVEFKFLKKNLEKELNINFQQIKNTSKEQNYFYKDATATYILERKKFDGLSYRAVNFGMSLIDKNADKITIMDNDGKPKESIIVKLPE
jgi:hypothetical protein